MSILKGIRAKVKRFKKIFEDNWLNFTLLHPRYSTDYYNAEINKMLDCGTDSGGFAVYKCLKCGKGNHKVNFSCKSKACPQCGKRYSRESMEKIASKMFLGISYRQVVLTMPEQLRIPFYNHIDQSLLYTSYMKASYNCLQEVVQRMQQNKLLKIACISFIHTHGRNGTHNPHIHVVLGEGGFNLVTEEWVHFKKIPLSLLRTTWQKHLLRLTIEILKKPELAKQLEAAYPGGFYAHPGDKHRVPTKSYNGLIRYLTKYLSAPPIGVSKIVDYNNDEVKFYYQSHKTKQIEYETLDTMTFIGRMVQHILPKGFQRVRYYGLQATNSFKKWYEAIAKSAGDLIEATISYVSRIKYADLFKEVSNINPLQCQSCRSEMELIQLYHPSRGMFFDLLTNIT